MFTSVLDRFLDAIVSHSRPFQGQFRTDKAGTGQNKAGTEQNRREQDRKRHNSLSKPALSGLNRERSARMEA